tara:strand:- start:43642 stop:44190 length:549 start_codon:yes stop_codon:yes gene_type:complete
MLLLLCSSPSSLAKGYVTNISNKYDREFKRATSLYLPTWDYRWLKAQGYQESLLNPYAVSYVGASGIMQVMPATWNDITNNLGWKMANIFDPSLSIHAGAYYDSKLWKQWRSKRTVDSRRNLTFASYNAGLKSLLDAQKACHMKTEWEDISPCLVQITGKHSKETLTYVERINRWYMQIYLN